MMRLYASFSYESIAWLLVSVGNVVKTTIHLVRFQPNASQDLYASLVCSCVHIKTKDTSAEQAQLVALLRECIMIPDNVFTLPNFYTVADVQCIISYEAYVVQVRFY